MIEDIAAIKDKCWLHHRVIDALVVILLEGIPLCENAQGVTVLGGFIWILQDCDGVLLGQRQSLSQDGPTQTWELLGQRGSGSQ